MNFLSVCSGVEAASLAWIPLGWEAVGFSEIEKFPSALLAHRFPTVPNLGDMTRHAEWNIEPESIDVLVGGTPCQSFSVAGLRAGMADPRGNLALVYLAIAGRLRPRWVVWENVPGVLSSNAGRDFGSFIGGLAELGYGWAYRVLDAQYFGVPQRRQRVFVVGYLGDWRRATAVLFERASLRGDLAPSRAERKDVAGTIGARTSGGGGLGTDFDLDGGGQPVLSHTLNAGAMRRQDAESETLLAHTLRAQSTASHRADSDTYIPIQEIGKRTGFREYANAGSLRANGPGHDPVGTRLRDGMAVRRLMPVECERLQGEPDGWTQVPYRGKPASDGPRYKAIGNSMAIPVVRWIGERIAMVETSHEVK